MLFHQIRLSGHHHSHLLKKNQINLLSKEKFSRNVLLLSLQASDKEKRELWPFMRQSVQNQDQVSTSPPPPPLWPSCVPGGEGGGWDLNLTWLEWSDTDEMIFLKNLVLFSYKRRLSSDKPPSLNDSHFTNRNGKVRDRSQTVITFFTAMLVLLKNKPFSAGTDVTASCVHTFILASTVVILTFVFVLKGKKENSDTSFWKKKY